MIRHKLNLKPVNAKLKPLMIKLVIFSIIFLGACFIIISYLGQILKKSDYFKIKDILVKEADPLDLSYLKGRNIFTINLEEESGYISEFYPSYKKIRLTRLLPNRLFVDFIRRRPLGIIKLYRYFYVDEDALLFDLPAKSEEPELPLIVGLERKIFGPKSGKIYNIRELNLALNIIKEMKRNKACSDYKIKKIDVTNPASASFFIPDALEIKLGEDNLKDKVNILGSLLLQVKNELSKIKYIDLRFKEPVIKFKDAQ